MSGRVDRAALARSAVGRVYRGPDGRMYTLIGIRDDCSELELISEDGDVLELGLLELRAYTRITRAAGDVVEITRPIQIYGELWPGHETWFVLRPTGGVQ